MSGTVARGFLFFTHTEEGRRSLREFLQGMADAYFDPSFDLGPVCVHEAEGVLHDLSPVNPEKMSLAAYPYTRKPEDFRTDVRYMNGMEPTAEDFRGFCRNTGCSASLRNRNITDTLEALERYDRYLEALFHEIAFAAENIKEDGYEIESLYIGGGTPTTLDEAALEAFCRRSGNILTCPIFGNLPWKQDGRTP